MKLKGTLGQAGGRKGRLCLIGIAWAALSLAQTPPKYTITTVAGNGDTQYPVTDTEPEPGVGDDGPAIDAVLFSPFGVLLDGQGNLYIADQLHHRVREVTPDGKITTVAGSGTNSGVASGDAATDAVLNNPSGLAFDSSGNLYIADTSNNVIRKVTTTGTISTVVGNFIAGFSGDYDPTSTADNNGVATDAEINNPVALAFDAAGNLYIADTLNNRIRKVDTSGIITTFAGNGNTTSAIGDGGPAIDATLYSPEGLCVDATGNLYIADTGNGRVRKITPDGIITTVAGNGVLGFSGDGGPATEAALNYPKSVALDAAGNMFIVDSFNARVRMVTADGIISTIAGNGSFGYGGDSGPATSARLLFPTALALDAAGRIYFSDTQNNRVRLLTPETPVTPALPAISTGGVISASEFGAFPAVAPASWIEIHGSDLAAASRSWTTADFNGVQAPTTLAGTRVKIGGLDAFISYVSPTVVEVQLPANVTSGPQPLTVTTAAGTSAPYAVTVNPTQPGLYAPPAFKTGDRQYAGAVFPDGSAFVLPSGSFPGTPSRQAHPGDTIVLFGVGFGPVSPGSDAGEIVQQLNSIEVPIRFFFGQTPATVTYQGLVPGLVGLYQFNVVVPNIPASDAVPLTFTLGGASGTQVLYTAVQN